MAKHAYTYQEVVARRQDVRLMVKALGEMGYGDTSRVERKDMDKLMLELSELRTISYAMPYELKA